MASRTCESCQKWWYDDSWNEASKTFVFSNKINSKGPVQFERPKRPDGTFVYPPPCQHCPKKSPEQAKTMELSEKNVRTVEFYRRVRATCGACLNERMTEDETLMKNLATVDSFMRAHELTIGH